LIPCRRVYPPKGSLAVVVTGSRSTSRERSHSIRKTFATTCNMSKPHVNTAALKKQILLVEQSSGEFVPVWNPLQHARGRRPDVAGGARRCPVFPPPVLCTGDPAAPPAVSVETAFTTLRATGDALKEGRESRQRSDASAAGNLLQPSRQNDSRRCQRWPK